MRIPVTTYWKAAGAVAALVAAFAVYRTIQVVSIGAAYKAKILCSGIFIAHREPAAILESDLAADDLAAMRYITARVDPAAREVTTSLFGIKAVARYRPGFGCYLRHSPSPSPTPPAAASSAPAAMPPASRHMPPLPVRPNPSLEPVLDWAFAETDPKRLRRTRAVVILHRDAIVAERYAPGFAADTPLLGWSMAKVATNALVGILVGQGRLSLEGPAPVPEWRAENDPRREITLGQLLHMSSGLSFQEEYANPLQDVTYMLLGTPDAAAFAAGKPLAAAPGTRFSYSSGTTNIISRIMRQTLGDAEYRSFPRRALFERIGMESAVLEQDESGNFVCSSFMYATARDWARLGQLYLQDGVWQGERLLPQGWVSYSTTPAPAAPERDFGAHIWLKIPKDFRTGGSLTPLPGDTFHAVGHEGQFITVIPSRELVIVRLGLTRQPGAWLQDRFITRVLAAIAP